jgi:hypothetical protein
MNFVTSSFSFYEKGPSGIIDGVETPMAPERINAAAYGAPPWGINTVEIITCRFSWFVCESGWFMLVSMKRDLRHDQTVFFRWASPKNRM